MLSRFFINRPIFASVLAILMVLAGGIAVFKLPVAQYPDITPPMIQVTTMYPGADPQVVADTVASPIEQEVNGVDRMLYMSSTSASDGSYTLSVTFQLGTDPDMATVLVQNRVTRALAKLPQDVQRQGVQTKKASSTLVSLVCLHSPDHRYDDTFLTNYCTLNINDELSRLPGVGDVVVYPQQDYSMRIWLDPTKFEKLDLTTNDIVNAIKQQNVQVAAGQLGQTPAPPGTDFQLTVNTLGRLSNKTQFEDIIIKTGQDGRKTRVRDVARVDERGGVVYDTFSTFNGSPGATILVYQAPGSNALDVADKVQDLMKKFKKNFPQGMDYKVIYQISDFVRASVHEVVKTLFEAFVLVFIVVFIFLQDWRATLIPAITIPVSLIATFFVMSLMGFSVNMVTLFGMVLAIGIVVDDAIVVVENVERNMTQLHLPPKDAALRAMDEITGAIIGITLVLMAVFIPAAFLPGITGQLYRQFSLTIAFTTLFSAINALTLSPALCALLLRPERKKNFFFRGFNWVFDRFTNAYGRVVGLVARRALLMLVPLTGLLAITGWGFLKVPTGFVPQEDDGLIMVNVQMPDGASLERTRGVAAKVVDILKHTDGVADVGALGGYSSIDGAGFNLATIFGPLEPWDARLARGRSKNVIMRELAAKFSRIQEGVVFPFSLPAIPGVGKSGGFEMQLQDKGGHSPAELQAAAEDLAAQAGELPLFRTVYTTFRADCPRIFVDVNREKVLDLGVPLQSVFDAMQSYLGSTYVNDFNLFARTWQVKVQADSKFRSRKQDITRLRVRNDKGQMVPLGSLVQVKDTVGPVRIDRFQMFPSALVSGDPAPGVSTGQSLEAMEKLAQNLPQGFGYGWSGMSYQEITAGGQGAFVFALAILAVLLILAAQYESWTDPLAVILSVPIAALGAVTALMILHMDNNIYTQVGLVLLVGLAAKNAILIVSFARESRAAGKSVLDAAVEAAKLRIRPILMTSFAFILGVTPLVVASGAGAVSRRSLGTAVFGGMLGVTLLGIIFVPVLYVVMQKLHKRKEQKGDNT